MRASLPHLPTLLAEKAAPEALLRHFSAAKLPLQSRSEVSSLPYSLHIDGNFADVSGTSVWLIL